MLVVSFILSNMFKYASILSIAGVVVCSTTVGEQDSSLKNLASKSLRKERNTPEWVVVYSGTKDFFTNKEEVVIDIARDEPLPGLSSAETEQIREYMKRLEELDAKQTWHGLS